MSPATKRGIWGSILIRWRYFPWSKYRTYILVLSTLAISAAVLVFYHFEIIRRVIMLWEWDISRWSCVDLRTGRWKSADHIGGLAAGAHRDTPNYISHAFHPKVGIGNLLYIYASLWGIAKRNKLSPTIRHIKLHDVMEIELPGNNFFDLSDCTNFLFGQDGCCTYDAKSEVISQTAPGRNVSLWGYFQSYKYFHPEFQEDIKRNFRFKPEVIEHAKSVIEKAASVFSIFQTGSRRQPIVGIHIRRGDVLNTERDSFGHTVATKEYYAHALDFLRGKEITNPLYIVCTNDPTWARENLPISDMYLVEDQGPIIDLAVLAQADYLILSVGTYSFFAGYLSHAQIITYYSNWPRPGSDFAKMTDPKDFWLPEWIALD